jgi:hypothetical protein
VNANGFVCGPRLYRFEGWFFEFHSYCGPWPLRKDGELRARADRKFWQMIERFQALPKAEQETYRAGGLGGCVPLGEVTNLEVK